MPSGSKQPIKTLLEDIKKGRLNDGLRRLKKISSIT